ncbi:MAG: outer membrane protein assembly factor BamB [Myxococcota bacterium]
MTRCLTVLLAAAALVACGEDAVDPPADASETTASETTASETTASETTASETTASETPPTVNTAAGIPGATAVSLQAGVQWLSADDTGRVWLALRDGSVGVLQGGTYQPALTVGVSTETIEVIVPPPVLGRDGTLVLAEAIFDNEECKDRGMLRWVDGTTGQIAERELQEAPAYPLAVATDGTVFAPTIEYKWTSFNGSEFCTKAQPESTRMAAYSHEVGLLWFLDLDRPPGPAVLSDDDQTGWFSDRDRSIVAFDYSGFGQKIWTTAIGETGTVNLSDPARGKDNLLFVAGRNTLAAIDGNTGDLQWEVAVPTTEKLTAAPVIDAAGTVLVMGAIAGSASNGRRWALFGYGQTGQLVQSWEAPDEHLHAPTLRQMGPTVLADGTIITLVGPGSGGANALFVWRSTGDPTRFEDFDGTQPLALDNGDVLFGWQDGSLLTASLSTGGLAPSPWPRTRGSNRRSGLSP